MVKALTFFVLMTASQIASSQLICADLFVSNRDNAVWPPPKTQQIKKFQLSAENFLDLGSLRQNPYGINEEVEGAHFARLFTMVYQEHLVFAKVSHVRRDGINTGDRTLADFTNEVAWVKRLSELGLGPKFYGFSTTAEGNYVVISEFIEGLHVSITPDMDAILPMRFRFHSTLIQSLRQIQSVVREQGIVLKDLDLRLSEDRAFVIDPEEFRVAERPEQIEESVQLIERFIQQLLKRK